MSSGFRVLNNNNEVLVSSDTRNLHFIGKAVLHSIVKSVDTYGGIRQWLFRIQSSVVPMPFFTMPTADYYGIAAVRNVGSNLWEIEVIRSGTSTTVPEIYVFADPRSIQISGTNYGVIVYNNDGTPSFDSRLRPLVVSGGGLVQPPLNPRVASVGSMSAKSCHSTDVASNSLGPDSSNLYKFTTPSSKPIYYYPTIAQAQREYTFNEAETECDDYGLCLVTERSYRWRSTYWAFYRSGIKRTGSSMYCGWITVEFGCNYDYKKSSTLLGIGIGGDSGSGGTWPYSNETLNLTPTSFIVSEGARYD